MATNLLICKLHNIHKLFILSKKSRIILFSQVFQTNCSKIERDSDAKDFFVTWAPQCYHTIDTYFPCLVLYIVIIYFLVAK